MLSNNKMSYTLTKNPESQNQTKHINMICHHIYRLVEDRKIKIK